MNTCHHVFDHWATIPWGIPNVCNFEDLHKSRVNRLARRGNIARVSDELGQRADLCRINRSQFCYKFAVEFNLRRYTKDAQEVALLVDTLAGGSLRIRTRLTCSDEPRLRVRMSIHPEGTSCGHVRSRFEWV